MSVLFFIRRNRTNDDVEAPIYMRVTIEGERFELGTKTHQPYDGGEAIRSKVTNVPSMI